MLGKKKKDLVIWKYQNPICFKNIRQKKKWMMSSLFDDWVRKQDRKMICQKWEILLIHA